MTEVFEKALKTLIFGPFCPYSRKIFWKIGLSVFRFYNNLPSCKKKKKKERRKKERWVVHLETIM